MNRLTSRQIITYKDGTQHIETYCHGHRLGPAAFPQKYGTSDPEEYRNYCEMVDCIARYEDTDLLPAEITAMKDENARLARELEAAKEDLRALSDEYKFCNRCKYHNGEGVDTCSHPLRFSCDAENFYEWRGVCPANTPAQGATDETRGGGEG